MPAAEPAFFVNLPVRYIEKHPGFLDHFIRHRLHPEIGLDPMVLDHLDRRRHQDIARCLADAGLAASIHLPFFDLQPGSLDDLILEATRERLRRALEVAAVYSPRHLIGHAQFTPLYADFREEWLERSVATWSILRDTWPDHPPLFIENTHETDPDPVAGLLARLDMPNTGICFDIGHWYSFAGGRTRPDPVADLHRWLDTLAPWLGHLHLHDNDGTMDQHLGLGQGHIPFQELLASLKRRNLTPTITLEPHTEDALAHSLGYIEAYGDGFRALRS